MFVDKLPPKPSLKGNDWAVDASDCQACGSTFTFFHRKHHCRRCGGIFCGDCTQQKINLRGQGEGPVRVCDACKKLEDAARLELRSGYRHRVSKGASKPDLSNDPTPLSKEIVGWDSTYTNIKNTNLTNEVSDLIARSQTESTSLGEAIKAGNDELLSSQVTPEMLLSQAQEEKKLWISLKREGKGNEALQAFKRSKELERQAESLKLFLRRSQKNAVTSSVKKERDKEANKMELKERTRSLGSESSECGTEKPARPQSTKKSKEGKEKVDEMLNALKELGWNDADLLDAEGRQNKAKTVESELAELAAATRNANEDNHQKSISSMEVLAHKRKALALKKEGNMAEAKEELKKAKLLERQLEEQQMLGDEEDESDDDLRALMKEIDKGGADDSMDMDMDFSLFSNIQEDDDQGLDVDDIDMDDPEMLAALKSMGWDEEAAQMEKTSLRARAKPRTSSHKQGQSVEGAFGCLEGYEGALDEVEAMKNQMEVPYFPSSSKGMGFEGDESVKLVQPVLSSVEDKKKLQQEVILLKKEALALKRTGRLQEAKDELRHVKVLEKQLHEMKSRYNDEDVLDAFSKQQYQDYPSADTEVKFSDEDHEVNVDVTEDDMEDPELTKTLKSLGWKDDDENDEALTEETGPSEEDFRESHRTKSKSQLQKDLLGIKRAALKLRREGKAEEAEEELKKALVIEELMEDLGRASGIKKERPIEQEPAVSDLHLEENVNVSPVEPVKLVSYESGNFNEAASFLPSKIQSAMPAGEMNSRDEKFFSDAQKKKESSSGGEHFQDLKQQKVLEARDPVLPSSAMQVPPDQGSSSLNVPSFKSKAMEKSKVQDLSAPSESKSTPMPSSQQQVLLLKRQALALKREGRQLEAKEKLKEAKILEKTLATDSASPTIDQVQMPVEHREAVPPPVLEAPPTSRTSKAPLNTTNMSAHKSGGKDRMKLQQESLAHKRKALALRREGKTEEADAEFELAKSIEKNMEDLGSTAGAPSAMPQGHDVESVDDLFDPQLLAALKGLGWKESDIHGTRPEVMTDTPERSREATGSKLVGAPISSGTSGILQSNERQELEVKIKSEKGRALKLKRAGQQKEALEVLRGAKLLEKKLQSLS